MNPLTTTRPTTTSEITASVPGSSERPGPPGSTEGPRTLGEMALDASERHSGIALQSVRGGETIAITYPELGGIVTEIARGLVALGIELADRVAILAATSAEWTLADYGALCAGAIVTPIYHTNSPEECAYVPEPGGEGRPDPRPLSEPRARCAVRGRSGGRDLPRAATDEGGGRKPAVGAAPACGDRA